MKTKLAFWAGAVLLALTCLAGVTSANATMLVDRGLPTTNLNNIAGSNRSNVAWLFGGSSADYWIVGDTFTNTGSQTWAIDTIRLWSVGATGTAALWGGIDGSTIGLVSGSGTISGATYADSSLYQGSSGRFIDMHQIDFAVSILLAPGQTYDFFHDGTGNGNYVIPFVHASNAPLSGSPQDGANGLMLYANVVGGVFDPLSVGTWNSLGDGWDKPSDVNVQAFGTTTVPEPATLALFGLGLVGLGFSRRRKQV
ncbi:MAG: PEP-CTERM sorting domain-containing protein [Sulfuriferula sp.]